MACNPPGPRAGIVRVQQERFHYGGEAIGVFPEQQVPQPGEGDQAGAGDAASQQLGVTRVHDGVGAAVHHEGAGLDPTLPQPPSVAGPGHRLGRQNLLVHRPRALHLH